MKRAISTLCAVVVVVVISVGAGCALTDAGVFGPSPEEQRDALRTCGVRIVLPFCLAEPEAAALPAWSRIPVSSEDLLCLEELGCGARNLEDLDVAANTRADVFECLGTADPAQFAPTTDEVRQCQDRCLNTLDFVACDNVVALEDDDLVNALDTYDDCAATCERNLGV